MLKIPEVLREGRTFARTPTASPTARFFWSATPGSPGMTDTTKEVRTMASSAAQKEAQRRYSQTEAGKQAHRDAQARYAETRKGAKTRARYEAKNDAPKTAVPAGYRGLGR
jgi:uncharacterized protein YdaU (DUF1376 family)